jgi:hypothetical protein
MHPVTKVVRPNPLKAAMVPWPGRHQLFFDEDEPTTPVVLSIRPMEAET